VASFYLRIPDESNYALLCASACSAFNSLNGSILSIMFILSENIRSSQSQLGRGETVEAAVKNERAGRPLERRLAFRVFAVGEFDVEIAG